MNKISVRNLEVQVIKKDIKNLHLWVYPPFGRVRVAVPHSTNDDAVRLFIVSKIPWINKQKKKFLAQDRHSKREYINWESHYFMWKRYLLNLIEVDDVPKVEIRNKKYIDLHIKPCSNIDQKERVIKARHRNELIRIIPPFLEKREKITWVQASSRRIQQMKTKRWSCSIDSKRILFNLELAKKSPQCIEYIVVHEMVHLLERTHNNRFIAYMDQFLPNRKQLKDELNRWPLSIDDRI